MIRKILALLAVAVNLFHFSLAQVTFHKGYGGVATERGASVVQTREGGYAVVGDTYSSWYDIYLLKTDSLGVLTWTKVFIGDASGSTAEIAYSLKQTSDDGYIISGITNAYGAGGYDIYLIKTDPSGNTIWAKTFGGASTDEGDEIEQTPDGGYIISGSTNSFSAGTRTVFLMKLTANGSPLWTKTYGETGVNYYCRSVQMTIDGGYMISGENSVSQGNVFIIKTDLSGNLEWAKEYGGVNRENGKALQTLDGGYIISGSTQSFGSGGSDVFLIKIDSAGVLLWSKYYGGIYNDYGNFIEQTADSGYIFGGASDSPNANGYKHYLIKTDLNGDTLWSEKLSYYGAGVDLAKTLDGGYIITGKTSNLVFGGDLGLLKVGANGEGCSPEKFTNIIGIPSFTTDTLSIIVNSVAITSTNPLTNVNTGGSETILCSTIGINDALTPLNLQSIYPNPNSGNFTISFNKIIKKGNLQILNLLGDIVFEDALFEQSQKEIRLKNISQGIYFVKVFDGEWVWSEKISIQ